MKTKFHVNQKVKIKSKSVGISWDRAYRTDESQYTSIIQSIRAMTLHDIKDYSRVYVGQKIYVIGGNFFAEEDLEPVFVETLPDELFIL